MFFGARNPNLRSILKPEVELMVSLLCAGPVLFMNRVLNYVMLIRSAIGPQRTAGFDRAVRWVLVVGPAPPPTSRHVYRLATLSVG